MPIGFRNFRSIPTRLKLNGPIIKYTAFPEDGTERFDGTVIFTAEAIAEFPNTGSVGSGGYNFDWYYDGKLVDSGGEFSIVESLSTSSTLTLTNISIEDTNKEVYCEVEYLTAPFEGEPRNSPLKSNVATITAFPELRIIEQPVNQVTGSDVFAKYTCEGAIVPSTQPQDMEYQWLMNDVELIDGSNPIDGAIPLPVTMEVTSDKGDNFTIDFENITSVSDWKTDRTYTLVVRKGSLTTRLYCVGGGGGGSKRRAIRGSSGGAAQGDFTFVEDQVYKLQVGKAGQSGSVWPESSIIAGGFPGGGDVKPTYAPTYRYASFYFPVRGITHRYGGRIPTWSSYRWAGRNRIRTAPSPAGGAGGGYTGLFLNSVSRSNSIIIAGGGGGSYDNGYSGGFGGGDRGSQSFTGGGGGGTQSSGGEGAGKGDPYPPNGGPGQDGSSLNGGDSPGGGAGGSGYYGGGGASFRQPQETDTSGPGGGGSGFLHPSLIKFGEYSRTGSETPQTTLGVDGNFKLVKLSIRKNPATCTVSGAKTENLSIKSDADGFGSDLRCRVSSNSAQFSPVFSNTVNFYADTPVPVIVFEAYDTINKQFKTSEFLLNKTSFTLKSDWFGSNFNLINFYSKEGNFNFKLDINAAAGKASGIGARGGEGGTSTIQINAKRQTEYTILGISNNSAIFIYEKARLIACIGQGGAAGKNGNGGDGGGVNVDGRPGSGLNPGFGGERPVSGTLDLNGSYGSVLSGSNVPLYTGDDIKNQQDGGKTISCTKGSYYINQGISPCEDVSSELIKFVDNSGTTYDDSSELFRGFKPGYTITDTAGASADDSSGNGGNGATGGDGGSNQSGGGGGSGYVDDSVVIISTSVGGNKDQISSIRFSI